MSEPRHLVLGGSHGIGYAYAKVRARQHGGLILVGRSSRDLKIARTKLIALGAPAVAIHSGDLVDADFRLRLREALEGLAFNSMLVGGPSPPLGQLDEVTLANFASALEIVLQYPFEFLEWGLQHAVVEGGEVYLIGSSASEEPACDHEFFLSALLRRTLDQLVQCLKQKYETAGKRLTLWRPKVVMTRLATRYARLLTSEKNRVALHQKLAEHFKTSVPDADEFVIQALNGT